MLHEVIDFCIAQQRFGWDTTPIQADPPQGIALHQRHLHAELGRPNRRHVSSGTSTEDDQITCVLGLCHVLPFERAVLVSG